MHAKHNHAPIKPAGCPTHRQKALEAKARLPQELRGVSILRVLTAFVTPLALKAVTAQSKRLKCEPTVIMPVRARLRGSCSHKIQERWYDQVGGYVLKIGNIHPHWRSEKPQRTRRAINELEDHTSGDEDAADALGTPPPPSSPLEDRTISDDLLRVQKPAIVKPKGHPRGSLNKAFAAPSQSQRRR